MPPKPKITREMVVDAAFEVARQTGSENINARTVSKQLNCSTQPVMYHFATIEALKKAAYEKADNYHTQYLMHIPKTQKELHPLCRRRTESVPFSVPIGFHS